MKKPADPADSTPSLEVIAARFTYASAAATMVADILSLISAGIALKILEEQSGQQTFMDSAGDFEQMQKEIDKLIRELRKIRKMMDSN